MSTDTIESTTIDISVEEVAVPFEDDGSNSENFAHIVNPPSNRHIWDGHMSSQEMVNYARINKKLIVALCGKTWVPKRNPEKHPACQTCFDIAAEIMSGAGE